MIRPEDFYRSDETLDRSRRKAIWRAIEASLGKVGVKSIAFIPDRRSFLFGVAAAVIVYFASVGVLTTVRKAIEHSTPEAIRLDDAYETAIEGFEKIVPSVSAGAAGNRGAEEYLSTRRSQLEGLDAAIDAMRKETPGADLSPLKRKRLRELYGLKLRILQEIVEDGNVETL